MANIVSDPTTKAAPKAADDVEAIDATKPPSVADYKYKRFTPHGRLSDSTTDEDFALAARILADTVFSAQIFHQVKRKLDSDNPDEVYKGLQAVYRMEDKIFHLGGWDKFLIAKEEERVTRERNRFGTADYDVLAADQSDGSPKVNRKPEASIAELRREEENRRLIVRSQELLEMDVPWSSKIRRGLRSNSAHELERAIGSAEKRLEEIAEQTQREANPLPYLQDDAAELIRALNKAWIPLAHGSDERINLLALAGQIEVSWGNLEALEAAVVDARTALAPPPEEPMSLLPPIQGGTTDWSKQADIRVAPADYLASRVQGGTPQRGQTRGGTTGEKKHRQKGGGVKSRPTRTGGRK